VEVRYRLVSTRANTWANHATSALDGAGLHQGRARQAVIEVLARNDCCLDATEIFDELRAEGRRVGLASVYRALEQLSRLRLVQRIEFGDVTRFERALPDGDHHHHVVCDDCGRVEPFADRPLEKALDRLGGSLGFDVEGHDVVLRGSCADCRR
jgi:Fur family transcriptional regulator, ferric uptake regulator